MKTNDIKKGMIVRLDNGWYGIMADNQRGNIRMVDVDGLYREIGSVYAHDIVLVWDQYKLDTGTPIPPVQCSISGKERVTHTPTQLKLRDQVTL